jgi:hypothetical protein
VLLPAPVPTDIFHTADGIRDFINCGDGSNDVVDTDPVDTKTSNCFA